MSKSSTPFTETYVWAREESGKGSVCFLWKQEDKMLILKEKDLEERETDEETEGGETPVSGLRQG